MGGATGFLRQCPIAEQLFADGGDLLRNCWLSWAAPVRSAGSWPGPRTPVRCRNLFPAAAPELISPARGQAHPLGAEPGRDGTTHCPPRGS